jgi:hypothetical protein
VFLLDYIDAHQAEFWLFVGFALLALEALALGFTSGFVLFGSVGALLTGALMKLGVLPQEWSVGVAGTGIGAAVSAVVLWKPFRWLQRERQPPKRDRSSDLIGYDFILRDDIDDSAESRTSYSGVSWRVKPDPEFVRGGIEAGTRVRVSGVDAGIFWVVRSDRPS